MWTSCFSRVKELPADLRPVAISRSIPRGYKGARELRLAPTWAMLKLPADRFDAEYAAMLAQLDPQALAGSLGASAVLLCWEKPGVPCHRRTVASWFEQHLGIVVPEWEPGQ